MINVHDQYDIEDEEDETLELRHKTKSAEKAKTDLIQRLKALDKKL